MTRYQALRQLGFGWFWAFWLDQWHKTMRVPEGYIHIFTATVHYEAQHDDDEPREPQEFGCCLPPGECCMPGLHFPSECHTAQDYERRGRSHHEHG